MFGVHFVAGEKVISGDINTATTWKKSGSPYIINASVNVTAPLIIEPGVVVKFTNSIVSGNTSAGLQIKSTFTAVGSPSEQIIFTSACDKLHGDDASSACYLNMPVDWYSVKIYPETRFSAAIEYAKIFYAYDGINYGTAYPDGNMYKSLSVKHVEIGYSDGAGIFLRHTQPTLDELVLTQNRAGLEVYAAGIDDTPKIRNSAIFGNSIGVSGDNGSNVDARYNWWGDPSGPHSDYSSLGEPANPNGHGDLISGYGVLYRPWDQSDPTVPKEPVIFIPGIGASLNPDLMISGALADNWTMFDHTYDGILQAFKAMGYVEGKNFFIAYYDWRKSNKESVDDYLKPAIKKALEKSEATKVNIVTHSMGSLVARSYVQSDGYKNDVDNLIMIAPPNRGSSDVYAAWEGGYIPNNWPGRSTMVYYLAYLQVKNSGISRYDVIHQYIPSLKELMPTYDYLHPKGDSASLKDHEDMHEKNGFLLNLNQDTEKLDERTRDYIEKRIATLDKILEKVIQTEVEIDLDKNRKISFK